MRAAAIDLKTIREFRFALRRLEREVEISLSGQTECCGVTVAQCHLILELERQGPLCVAECAEALALDPSTLSRTVDGLAKKGLILREEDPVNRRKSVVRLSPEGQAKADFINQSCDSEYRDLLTAAGLDKTDAIITAVRLLSEAMADRRQGTVKQGCCKGVKACP